MTQLAGSLVDKTVIVTGAAAGVGAVLAARFAAEGCQVLLADQAEAPLRLTAAAIPGARWAVADVADLDDCVRLAGQAQGAWGRIDVLISAASLLKTGPLEDLGPDDLRQVMDVNLVGYYNCVKAVAPIMRLQGSGCVIQINSEAGKQGSSLNGVYAASRFAGLGLTQSLARELAEVPIRVNAICPRDNSTDLTCPLPTPHRRGSSDLVQSIPSPLKRITPGSDVADLAVFLASDLASQVTGQAIDLAGAEPGA
ncbi:MAG: SDR family oxidoreductase [Propionibacteriaceae bacterium]|jgi:sorbitol-6-phosphate 2-dehydrogenase|nr:SDR family oxidoreductase [Propionibacteriaceae bacterium]